MNLFYHVKTGVMSIIGIFKQVVCIDVHPKAEKRQSVGDMFGEKGGCDKTLISNCISFSEVIYPAVE